MADTPDQPIPLKAFHCRIPANKAAITKEEATWQLLPETGTFTSELIELNFRKIKEDVTRLVGSRLDEMRRDTTLRQLIITRIQSINCRRQSPS